MLCKEKTYLLIKRPGEAQEYNTKMCSVELLTTNSRQLDVAVDEQSARDYLDERVDLHVRIPRWIKMLLYDHLNQMYGGNIPKGALGDLVAELLAEALEARAASRPRSSGRVRPSRDREECERILAFLKTFITPRIEPGGSVSTILLGKAITMARGRKSVKAGIGRKADPRTIKKWLKRLEKLGYIAQRHDGTWAILYVPDDRRCEELLGDLWRLAQR